jgi:hypothetical protein
MWLRTALISSVHKCDELNKETNQDLFDRSFFRGRNHLGDNNQIYRNSFYEISSSRNHGPIHFIQEHGVFLRTAKIEDADQLIALNKAFRHALTSLLISNGKISMFELTLLYLRAYW